MSDIFIHAEFKRKYEDEQVARRFTLAYMYINKLTPGSILRTGSIYHNTKNGGSIAVTVTELAGHLYLPFIHLDIPIEVANDWSSDNLP